MAKRFYLDTYIPEPPCAYCAFKQECEELKQACFRFARYCGAADREIRRYARDDFIPHREIYQHLFPDTGDAVEWAEFVQIPSFLKRQAE